MTITEIEQAKELLEISERVIDQHEQTIIALRGRLLRAQDSGLLEAARQAVNTCPMCDGKGRYIDGSGDCQYCEPLRAAIAEEETKYVQS